MSATASSMPGSIADRYVVERELGRGATAIVYLARDLELGRMVALKVLRQELAESLASDRFLKEIKLTAQLHHPHIVPVLASGTHEGRLYFVLPYMDGGTLRERLKREKQLGVEEVVQIGVTLATALAFAHERNILHRDVKPENILFTNGQACLADFGIAKAITRASDESTTTTGLVRGTPAYMSPEQAAGDHDYDGRSDVYSLACVLYEALAGVPAFIGATPQAVVAQRITHEPRPVRVYRPSVPAGLEVVLRKALAIAPADRYQTAEGFGTGLRESGDAGVPARHPLSKSRTIWLSLAVAAVLALPFIFRSSAWFAFGDAAGLDTTHVVVLPFDGVPVAGLHGEHLMSDALRQWQGVAVAEGFTVSDAVRRVAQPFDDQSAARVARGLRAGRFVRGRIANDGGRVRVEATLFDSRNASVIQGTSRTVAADSVAVLAAFDDVADALMLRGASGSARPLTSRQKNLPATQAFLRAGEALTGWDLATAESLYVQSLQFDPGSPRAAFWLAQTRAWRLQPTETWRELASRAMSDTAALAVNERPLARALTVRGALNFPAACALYDSLTHSDPASFAAWYGLGECLREDQLVIADKHSPSGWSFRTSYNRAIEAYLRAFELVPSVYRSFQGSAYSRLASLLYVSNRYRRIGRSAGLNPVTFLSAPILQGDTLAFVAYPATAVAAVTSLEDPAATARAVLHNRAVFHQVTAAWASTFPRSAAAKEGLAISLELRGERAAVDTLKAAISLSQDPQQRVYLTANLAWLELKFGIGDERLLREARAIADSTLAANPAPLGARAEALGRLAAIVGRCSAVGSALRESAEPLRGMVMIPQRLAGEAQSRVVGALLGCAGFDSTAGLSGLVAQSDIDRAPPNARGFALTQFIGREVRSTPRFDSTWGARLQGSGDYLIAARLAIARGHPDSAARIMRRITDWRRGLIRGGTAPDAVVPETYVWLALHDTTTARERLDAVLTDAGLLSPMFLSEADNIVIVAATARALALRADLSANAADARRWARKALVLWDGSGPELNATIERMKKLAAR